MADSPNVLNYYIGKGEVSFKKDGDVAFRDLGNVTVFEFVPAIEKLEHFSSREGVRTKDRTVVIQKSGQVNLTMEEFTAVNLAIALLGDVSSDTLGREVIEIFSSNAVSGELKFRGTNEVGPRYLWHFLKVDFIPGESVSPLSDEWGEMQLTGDVSAVGGSFGTVTKLGEEGEPDVE
jgi:hypothetical protein